MDAQSGSIKAYKIIHDGKYLLVNAMDYGLNCYNLDELDNPKLVRYFESDFVSSRGKYVFIDFVKENIYNVFSASCRGYETDIEYNILCHGCRFKQDEGQQDEGYHWEKIKEIPK